MNKKQTKPKKAPKKLPKLTFTLDQLLDFVGNAYKNEIKNHWIDKNPYYKVLSTAKNSCKSFTYCAWILYRIINEPNYNVVVFRRKKITHSTTTIPTFFKVLNMIADKYGWDKKQLSKFKLSDSQIIKKINYLNQIIIFESYENYDKVSGYNHKQGEFGTIWYEEPVESNTKYEHINNAKESREFTRSSSSILRGKLVNKEILFSFNNWDDNHWAIKKYRLSIIPETEELWTILGTKGYKSSLDMSFSSGLGIYVFVASSLINEFKSEQEIMAENQLKIDDPEEWEVAVLGKMSNSESSLQQPFKNILEEVKFFDMDNKYIENIKNGNSKFCFGLDHGKSHDTTLSINILNNFQEENYRYKSFDIIGSFSLNEILNKQKNANFKTILSNSTNIEQTKLQIITEFLPHFIDCCIKMLDIDEKLKIFLIENYKQINIDPRAGGQYLISIYNKNSLENDFKTLFVPALTKDSNKVDIPSFGKWTRMQKLSSLLQEKRIRVYNHHFGADILLKELSLINVYDNEFDENQKWDRIDANFYSFCYDSVLL